MFVLVSPRILLRNLKILPKFFSPKFEKKTERCFERDVAAVDPLGLSSAGYALVARDEWLKVGARFGPWGEPESSLVEVSAADLQLTSTAATYKVLADWLAALATPPSPPEVRERPEWHSCDGTQM
jgi:hypothetical protein